MINTVYDCSVIELPRIGNRNGSITALNNGIEIPFDVKRVFYLYDIPGGESRGAHAHKECHQFLVAVVGSFDVELYDGNVKRTISLNKPHIGLHIPPGVWASEVNFSSSSICLVMASENYSENDYVRSLEVFIDLKKKK